MVSGGPLGFLSEGADVGGHSPRQSAVAGLDAEVAGEVAGVVPGPEADRGRLGCAEGGWVAVGGAAQHLLVLFPGRVPVGHAAGGRLAGVAAELLRLGDERGRDLGQAAARLQDQQDRGPVAVGVEEAAADLPPRVQTL